MKSVVLARYVVPNEAARRRHRLSANRLRRAPIADPRACLDTVKAKLGDMPASKARIERRRKAREGIATEVFVSRNVPAPVDGTQGSDLRPIWLHGTPQSDGETIGKHVPTPDRSQQSTMWTSRGSGSSQDRASGTRTTALRKKAKSRSAQIPTKEIPKPSKRASADDVADMLASCSIDVTPGLLNTTTAPSGLGRPESPALPQPREDASNGSPPQKSSKPPVELHSIITANDNKTSPGHHVNESMRSSQINSPESLVANSTTSESPSTDGTFCERSPENETLDNTINIFPDSRENIWQWPLTDPDSPRSMNTPKAASVVDDFSTRSLKQRQSAKTEPCTNRYRVNTDSILVPERKPSIPLHRRIRTDEGTLELKTSPKKTGAQETSLGNTHRRRISLNIPVRPSLVEGCFSNDPVLEDSNIPDDVLAQAESELEYIHRHTYIGTASLDDILELIEIGPSYATTKHSVTKAFIYLASEEQELARTSSTTQEGWNYVSRITSEISGAGHIAQAQVRLGSITLSKFLGLLQFHMDGGVHAQDVVTAFCTASLLDKKAGTSTESKAKAFRSWLVRQSVA